MTATFFPSGVVGDPGTPTNDAQSIISVSVRAKPVSTSQTVSGLRWFAAVGAVGTLVTGYLFDNTNDTQLAVSPQVTCIAGWNNLLFAEPIVVPTTVEVEFIVEQAGSAKYSFLSSVLPGSGVPNDGHFSCPFGSAGRWEYGDAAALRTSTHDVTTWFGVDAIVGTLDEAGTDPIQVTAGHSPSTVQAGTQVTLSASKDTGTGDGSAVSWAWSQTAGASVTLSSSSVASPTFTPTVAGTYSFQVTGTDSAGSDTATTSIVVTAADPGEEPVDTDTLWVKDVSGEWHAVGGSATVEPTSSSDPAWMFRPESFGAKGDGVYLGDVHTTSGSNVVTSAAAAFVAGDVGKRIIITDAGPGGSSNPSGSLFASITAVTDAHTVTLSASAGSAQTEAAAVYGTDDSQAFLDCMDAVSDYVFASPQRHAVVELGLRTYVLATKPTADTGGTLGRWSRAQVPLPYNPSQTDRKAVVEIRGPGVDGATFTSWHQTQPQLSGCVLFSMVEVTETDFVAGFPVACIGGPSTFTAWSGSNVFNNVAAIVDGVRVMGPHNPGIIGIDFQTMAQYHIGSASVDIFAAPHGLTGSYMKPTNSDGCGFRTNFTGLNDRCTIQTLLIQGYWIGAVVDEHCAWHNIAVIYSKYGLYLSLPSGGTVQHGAWIGYASVEISDYPLYVASADATFGLVIGMLDNEGPVIEHVHDVDGVLFGTVNLFPSGSAPSGPIDAIVSGGTNLTINNLAGGELVAPA